MNKRVYNKQYEATLNNLLEGFQLIGFDWRYLYLNEAIVKQSRYSRDELLGYTMMEKYPGIESTRLFQVLKECMESRISAQMDNEFTFPDGSKGWFELRIQPVQYGISILSIDITERKKAEAEKQVYIKGLEEMVFMTSHRVRQPVTNILGLSNLLSEAGNLPEDLNEMILYMQESALTLDVFTKELTLFITELESKAKNKGNIV